MAPDKHPESVPALLASLRNLALTQPKAVRATVHIYPAEVYANDESLHAESSATGAARARDRRITSWKMTEHMYFQSDNPFPTLARGLFTEELDNENGAEAVNAADAEPDNDGGGITGSGVKRDRIVARGYDKFFNIDEVAWTNWDAMEQYTQAPYHLTLKSNGCLILISALSPTELVVASKHSLGTTTETEETANAVDNANAPETAGEKALERQDRAHAEVGREWLKRTLQRSGKTEAELARRLWDENLTAVLELCDDDFEEHVIATPDYWTGLHLHGLNHNTPHFSTLPPAGVSSFAQEFGFIPTKVVELPTLSAVKEFTDNVAKTGSWEGDMIEGFVVRSTVHPSPDESAPADARPPYKPGAPFFFKVKFDEPYLLYRQWREVTRVLIKLLDKDLTQDKVDEVWKKAKKKVTRPEVGVYADWVAEELESNPKLFDDYDRGIVQVREAFLLWAQGEGEAQWKEAQEGKYKFQGRKTVPGAAEIAELKGRKAKAAQAQANGQGKGKGKGKGKAQEQAPVDRSTLPPKWIVVPMAVPGTGKTTVGLVLSKLFGWGHTQSDDVTTKKSGPTFLRNIAALLKDHDVVYADRNNHIDKHYEELYDLCTGMNSDKTIRELQKYNTRLIGIEWDIKRHPYHRLLRLCSDRVVGRGDNHATLRPDATGSEHEAIVGKFLRNYTSPDSDLFAQMIDVSVLVSPEEAVRHIISELRPLLHLPTIDDAQLLAAFESARQYKVTTAYHPPDKVSKAIRYYALAPEIDAGAVVEIGIYHMPPELAHPCQRFLSALQKNKRLISTPHVTLSHEGNVAEERESLGEKVAEEQGPQQRAWNACKRLSETGSPLWAYDVTHIAWDGRVMALILADLRILPSTASSHEDASSGAKLAVEGQVTEQSRRDAEDAILPTMVSHMHITVGTKTDDIRPYESRNVVGKAKEMIARGQQSGETDEVVEGGGTVRWAEIGKVEGEGRIKGMW